MDGVKITKRIKLRSPYFIVAWPGMGEVAFKSAKYLVEKLPAAEFAELAAEEFFYLGSSAIKNGVLELPDLPSGKFYYWKNPVRKRSKAVSGTKAQPSDLVIFLSNAQPDLTKADLYCKRIINVAKSVGAKAIIGFAAMPQPVDHMQEPVVWFAATTQELNNELKKYSLTPMVDGQISGMNGLFLGVAKKEGLRGFCLLGEIPLYTIQIENPKASAAVLGALNMILGMQLDLEPLKEQAHVMDTEINKLLDYLKLEPQGQTSPIGEDEIEKIKKTLSQLTKLPLSVKEKIEKMFEQVKADISKAAELKMELDKWNAYKDYEDRFLDLFKKSKEKEN